MSDSFATRPQDQDDSARFSRVQRRRLRAILRFRSRRAGYPIPRSLEKQWVDELEAATGRFEAARDLATTLCAHRTRSEARKVDRILSRRLAAKAV